MDHYSCTVRQGKNLLQAVNTVDPKVPCGSLFIQLLICDKQLCLRFV